MRMAECGQHLLYPVHEQKVKRKENKNCQKKVYYVYKPVLRFDIRIIERHCILEKDQKGISHVVSMRLLQIQDSSAYANPSVGDCLQKCGKKESTL